MVYLAYFGKEKGIAKVVSILLGVTIVGVGCHSYFASSWVKKGIHKICENITDYNLTSSDPPATQLDAYCPGIGLEKYFIAITLFCFSLSLFGLLGNIFTKQMSRGVFKSVDMVYQGVSGVIIIIGGSLYLYSTVKIDALFIAIGKLDPPCLGQLTANSTYQLYGEKLAAGSLSIINGLVYMVVALLLFIR